MPTDSATKTDLASPCADREVTVEKAAFTVEQEARLLVAEQLAIRAKVELDVTMGEVKKGNAVAAQFLSYYRVQYTKALAEYEQAYQAWKNS